MNASFYLKYRILFVLVFSVLTAEAQVPEVLQGQMQDSLLPMIKPGTFIYDQEGVFSQTETSNLEARLSAYEQETSRKIAVVTFEAMKPYDNIENYAAALIKKGVEDKAVGDNGLILLFSIS
ncbi:MAG: TPM domain-containing protein, partial [Leeuwenhoekiella sp.]